MGTLEDGSLAEGWLGRAQQWLHEAWSHTLVGTQVSRRPDGHGVLSFQLHPAAGDIVIAAVDRTRLEMAGSTWELGPGYHAHLCELLHTLEREQCVRWHAGVAGSPEGDATGFFWSGEVEPLERQALLSLQEYARAQLSVAPRAEAPWPLPGAYQFDFDGEIATALGPRNRDWLSQVVADPSRGRDVFPWWEQGLGSAYRLGRASTEMWLNVRWRLAVTEAEKACQEQVLALLAQAHATDPKLDFPWKEWRELRSFVSDAAPVRDHGAEQARPPIGYRRRPVRVSLPGSWSLQIPGPFAESWEEGAFTAWLGGRTILFASGDHQEARGLTTGQGSNPRPLSLAGIPPQLTCQASSSTISTEGGAALLQIMAVFMGAGKAARVTILLDDPAEEPWAIAALESLRHDPGACRRPA